MQAAGKLNDAEADDLAKAAVCLPCHYNPVNGTVANAAAGDEVRFISFDLKGKVRFCWPHFFLP